MKKNISIILVLAMVITLFAGCAAKTSTTDAANGHGFGPNNFVVNKVGGSDDSSSSGSSSGSTTPTVPVPGDTTTISITGVEDVRTLASPVNEFSQPSFNQTQKMDGMCYSYYIPSDYDKNKKYPVILFLHGIGSSGSDWNTLSYLTNFWSYNGDIVRDAIIISPQATSQAGLWGALLGNDDETAFKILEKFEKDYSVDMNRIYIVGLSMGGIGTWLQLVNHNTHFAAAVPTAGASSDAMGSPSKLVNIPIWCWHGTADNTTYVQYNGSNSTPKIYDAIVKAGGTKINFTKITNGDHASGWNSAFADRGLVSWLFMQNKSSYQDKYYNFTPYITVKDASGKVIISELDATSVSNAAGTGTKSGMRDITLNLSDAGLAKLNAAYQSSNGNPFTVRYGDKVIATFTATSATTNKAFTIRDVFTSSNYTTFYTNKLTRTVNKSGKYCTSHFYG